MTPWIYSTNPKPQAIWGLANGRPSVMLHMPDGRDDEDRFEDMDPSERPGGEEWEGETAIFQGDRCSEGLEANAKQHAVAWLEAALESVRALPEPPTYTDGKPCVERF